MAKKDWNKIIEDQLESGLTVKEYCRVNKMSQSNFYRHKQEMSEDSDHTSVTMFTPVIVENEIITFSLDGHQIICSKNDVHLLLEALL